MSSGNAAAMCSLGGVVKTPLNSSAFLQGVQVPRQQHARWQVPAGALRCRAAVAAGEPSSVTEARKVKLGQTDVEVPEIGIGAWSWGDKFYWNDGDWSDRKLKDAKFGFEVSMAAGIGFFDTAEVYGTKQFGGEDSEKLLGRFIQEREKKTGDRPLVATKYAALPWRLGRQSVVAALRESLERLSLPQVDLYQLHWPGIWGNEGYIDGLADCVELGLTRAVGVSNYSEKRLRDAHAQLAARGVPLASNQVHYNLLYRLPEENGVKRACEELGVSVIAYSPLAQGVLSGKYTPESPPTGPRAASYTPEFLTKAQPLLTRLKELGSKYGKTPIQVSLNWLVAQGDVIPIPGAKNKEQAAEFAGALGWSLSADEVEELRQLALPVPKIQGFPVEAW